MAFIGIATALTAAWAWFFKSSIDNLKTHTDETVSRLSVKIEDSSKGIKHDFKDLSIHVNDRFEKFYEHMDTHKKEINARFDRQVDTINATLRELSRNIERIKDDVHKQEKSFLELRLDITEKFATKEELKQLEKHVTSKINVVRS